MDMNKLLPLIIIALSSFVSLNLIAQPVEEPKFQKSFKAYTNPIVFRSWTPNGLSSVISSGLLSFAFQLENQKGHFH